MLYVILEVEDKIFKTDAAAGKRTWQYTVTSHQSKIAGKDISDHSVREFIEALINRYKPGDDVPTGDVYNLGVILRVDGEAPEKPVPVGDIEETPNNSIIPTFEINENPQKDKL